MKTRAHQTYKTEDGIRAAGVTTVLGVLAKPGLIPWAWGLGMKGIDYRKFRDDKAEIGTLAHYLILCDFRNVKPDISDYSPNQVKQAESCLLKFWDWKKQNPIEALLVEEQLVSERYRYGGTLDLYGKMNAERVLVDFKTGKGIYPGMIAQLAAYGMLLVEHGYPVDRYMILRIGRNENEGFETFDTRNVTLQRKLFLHCLEIYNLQKKIKRGATR